MDKKNLRKQMRIFRNQLPETERVIKSRNAAKRLTETTQYKLAQNILIYMHYGSELKTSDIIKQAFLDKKHVFVPRVEEETMDFYEIHSVKDCVEGFRGIPEPQADCCRFIPGKDNGQQSIMILPGLAFDKEGHRLGYGGGYYDRYLEQTGTACIRIAVGYDDQLIEKVPYEVHDIPVDMFVSDLRCIRITDRSGR